MSEYGIAAPDDITWRWTPAQVMVMAEAIRRRRAARAVERLHLNYIVAAAAQGGKKAFQALKRAARELRKEAGLEKRQTDVESIVQALGLKDLRQPKAEE